MGGVTFKDLLDQKTWEDYGDFVRDAHNVMEKEVKNHVESQEKLIKGLKQRDEWKKLDIRDARDNFDKAEKLLLGGDVVGVDGTNTDYRLLSGLRCQIGVVAVNYAGEKIRHAFFISEADLTLETDDVIEAIKNRKIAEENLPSMYVRGLRNYREREAGFHPKFKDKFVMIHGPLLPFELMSGLGRLRALDVTLDLLKKLITEKRFFSVLSSTSYQDWLTFGLALEPFQYFTVKEFTLGSHIANSGNFMSYKDKWREEEFKKAETFLRDYAEQILIGVIRVGDRPYIFHAHKDNFDIAASIIARDAMFQKEKGFPLLIDYADSLCSKYFSATDFKSMMQWQLAKNNHYMREASERELRMK